LSGLQSLLERIWPAAAHVVFDRPKLPSPAEKIGRAAIRATDRFNAAVDDLNERYEDPLAAMVHRAMDRRRAKLRKDLDL
jgi:hypothetical protein